MKTADSDFQGQWFDRTIAPLYRLGCKQERFIRRERRLYIAVVLANPEFQRKLSRLSMMRSGYRTRRRGRW